MINNNEIKYLKIYSNFFNRSYLFDLIYKKENKIKKIFIDSINTNQIFKSTEIKTYKDLLEYTYKLMENYYRCEYVFLNSFFVNQILQNHDENHAVLSELIVKDSQADLVVINGTTTVYEIKTELDSLDRLSKQLNDYSLVFDHVNVITTNKYLNQIRKIINKDYENVGLLLLKNNGELIKKRSSKSNLRKLDKSLMFSILNKADYEKLDLDYYKAKNKFIKLSKIKAHEFLKNSLFERSKNFDLLQNYPDSLKLAIYKIQNRLTKMDQNILLRKLNSNILED